MIIGIFAGHGLGDRLKKVSYFFTATTRVMDLDWTDHPGLQVYLTR